MTATQTPGTANPPAVPGPTSPRGAGDPTAAARYEGAEAAAEPFWVLIDRKGSGRVVHRGTLHGVSSVRTRCGRLLLRVETAGILDHQPARSTGVRPCPKCELAP